MRKKISSPVDFENMPTDHLLMYIDFYRDKIDEGEPMDDYYRNMLTLATAELEKRREQSLKNIKKLVD
ncbi:hypothetical protein Spock_232 [Bacillus phage Spock]|uniref:Uncharacterized protein n=1 Tax=Bacillus phage Spock TaxID=1406791 RepID=U5Q110_9CAUD|nr:hypothetical protein Spock_232 [Bacillus phage Spock]AGY48632.1 hypothetical protein Spock_232 [Bacillus phage Spock]